MSSDEEFSVNDRGVQISLPLSSGWCWHGNLVLMRLFTEYRISRGEKNRDSIQNIKVSKPSWYIMLCSNTFTITPR